MKTVAFWRRVISSMRGCDQFPGLSVTGAGDGREGVVLEGVRVEALVLRGVSAVDDMFAIGASAEKGSGSCPRDVSLQLLLG